MESWNYGSEGKGFVLSDEMISTVDAFEQSRKGGVMGWDLRTPCHYESAMLVPGRQAIENQGFMELDFPEIIKKPPLDNPIGGGLGDNVGKGRVASPTYMVTQKAFFGEEETSSRLSSSVVESSNRDSSLIDLKLGRLGDYRDAQNGELSKQTPVLSSVGSSVQAKRSRSTSLNSQTPFCQVEGCNINLSSSKDYHRRHKVCEVHSKTPKVIVNGVEQRFCQQCSRFHFLAEFDNGKRSCRKRLAGHNERRRKPQLGSRFLGTPSSRTSFICSDMFPNSILHPVKNETDNWCKQIKLEDGAVYNSQSVTPITNGHLLPRSFLPPYGMEKQYPSSYGNTIDTAPGSSLYENSHWYPHDLSGPNPGSRSLFRNMSSGREDFPVFDTASTIQGISRVLDSDRALSLLSSQSQNSPSHTSGVPLGQPPIFQRSHAHQIPGKLIGVSSQASTSVASNKFSSSEINSTEVDHLETVLVSDASDVADFEVHTEGIFQGSNLVDAKDSLSHGPTIDLLQLSSQLQHVEHQRRSLQVKQENGVFCCLPIT